MATPRVSVAQDNTSESWYVCYEPNSTSVYGQPITFSLNQSGAFNPELGKLTPPLSLITTPGKTFALSVVAGPIVNGEPKPPAVVNFVIDPSIWTFQAGEDYRKTVISDFDAFFEALEKLEGLLPFKEVQGPPVTYENVFYPGTTEPLRSILAHQIPATFAESLYFHYGFRGSATPARGFVDLTAGMRLRMDYEYSQFISPATNPLVSGYVAGGQSVFDIVATPTGKNGAPQLGFNAFLTSNPLPKVLLGEGGAGGIIDLQGVTKRHRHLRVCYPTQFTAADSPGFVGTRNNVTLLGTDNLTDMNTATKAYYAGTTISTDTLAAYFRGRVVMIPELPCFTDIGSSSSSSPKVQYVPVGTSLRQFGERFSGFPRVPNMFIDGFSGNFQRVVETSLPSPGDNIKRPNVAIPSWAGKVASTNPKYVDGFDVPLLAHDLYKLPSY